MEWKYVKPLKSEGLIKEFETLVGYKFQQSFINHVISKNGAKPSSATFDTKKRKECEVKSLLSFNYDDRETVWKIFQWNNDILNDAYVPFALDNFGNLICFDVKTDAVIFLNHENVEVENIADNFDDFINCLY